MQFYVHVDITFSVFENCSLVPRVLSLAVAFHTASDKTLGDKPGNEATKTVHA